MICLKILLNEIFVKNNFRNEIAWRYIGAGYPKNDFGRRHDIIFRYSKTQNCIFNLDILSLNNLLNRARAIAEMCKVRLEQLKPYEIDEVSLTNLQIAIEKLAKLNAHRDAVVDFRMENTSSIINLFNKTRQELKTLDALVEGFVDDEAFLAVYFSSRRIHDMKGGGKKVESSQKSGESLQ
jgi:hypothetical protein